jgi:23S rRNA (adenine-N6)-dimethyltransferase
VAGRRPAGARQAPRSQHFLRTRALAAQLVVDACIGPDDLVLDLGAGSGRLTAELAARARRVLAVELDPSWAARLGGRWPNVDVFEGDATKLPLPRSTFRVVSNLPFHRTTDLLHVLLDDPTSGLARADLVVEWGVAFRYGVPWPSTLNGVTWGAFYETTITRRLSRIEFDPPPATDAGVLVFTRRPSSLVPVKQASAFRSFAARGFRRGLRSVASSSAIARVGHRSLTARELDAYQWAELFRRSSA